MGREQVTLRLEAYVSRHNSEQDRADDELWEQFKNTVAALAADPRYEQIDLDVWW